MLRQTNLNLNYNFKNEFWRARSLLRGRAKLETKLGMKAVHVRLAKYTRFRLHHRKYDQRARIRSAVDSAAVEHGTGWGHIRNDLSKQNIQLFPSTQRLLAQYEPLAFRSILEVSSSSIVPPPSPLNDCPVIPAAPPSSNHNFRKNFSHAATVELKEMIASLLRADNNTASVSGTSSALQRVKVCGKTVDTREFNMESACDQWADAWKDFMVRPEDRSAKKAKKVAAE